MKHLGDISKINGAEIEPVDIVCFGSPCQSLSVAGKREGLKHTKLGDDETTRSGLFMEAVRIIKEMREATDGKYPRFALWENVPGAFSSNKGEDFRVVLEELIKIAEPCAAMPAVPPFGWAYADSYVGDGWSLAYRVFDTQYWPRTPQRRRRIYLVADFGGQRAREVLFERESLRGNSAEGRTPRKRITTNAENGTGAADCDGEQRPVSILNAWDSQGNQVADGTGKHAFPTLRGCGGAGYQAGYVLAEEQPEAIGFDAFNQAITGDKAKTLNSVACDSDHIPCVLETTYAVATQQGEAEISENGICSTATATAGVSGNNQPFVVAQYPYCKSARARSVDDATTWKEGEVANTLNTFDLGEVRANELVVQKTGIVDSVGGQAERGWEGEVAPTLKACHYKFPPVIARSAGFCTEHSANARSVGFQEEMSPTLRAGVTPAIVSEAHKTEAITVHGEEISGTLLSRDYKGAGRWDSLDKVVCQQEVAGVDCRNMNEYPELYPTLQAKPNGGQSLNFSGAIRDRYIIRRLTPTECARLQGFPDRWGHPDEKEDLTEEEYQFWLDARNTHAAINGKAIKDYTKEQMLKWYNKLHSDSAEYKMWGNGIALPPSLYCMQGIEDALNTMKEEK